MTGKRFLALLTAFVTAVLAVSALPVFARGAYSAPEGYNENDYQRLVAFLETSDGSGVKNGEKLSESYDPADPSTWDGVVWTGDEDNRVGWLFLGGRGLTGVLDLKDCDSLEHIDCSENLLTGLVISGCVSLSYLSSAGNRFTSLDLSDTPGLPIIRKLSADGPGTVSAFFELRGWFTVSIYAVPDSGAVFTGWYSKKDGSPVSSDPTVSFDPDYLMSGEELPDLTDLEARFVPLGDADKNGRVEPTDALIALRTAMAIIEAPCETAVIDVDGNGTVEPTDALLILRFAMGIITGFGEE